MPADQRTAAVKALVEESGADSSVLSALLAGTSRPPAVSAIDTEPLEVSSDGGRPLASASEGADVAVPSPGTKLLSDDRMEEILIAESAMAMSFKLLKEADSPEMIRASALALMESASRSGELAMLSAAGASAQDEVNKSGMAEACRECAQSLKSSYEKLQTEASSVEVEASAKSKESRLSVSEIAEWEGSAAERVARNAELMSSWSSLRDTSSQLKEKKQTLEKEISEMRAALERQQEEEQRMGTQFSALLRVETPQDRMVSQLIGLYLLSGMVGVNVSFVASGGSLAVSTLTSLLIRAVPQVIIYAAKLSRQPAK